MSRSPLYLIGLITATTLAGACGSGGNTTVGDASIALALSPTSASVTAGNSTTVTGTITRTNFTGDITINVTGAPAGVAGTVTQSPVSGGSTAQVTITTTSSAPPGVYPLQVIASGSGVTNATATYTLTVTAAANFTVATSPTSINVVQGNTVTTNVDVNRTGGFNGTIAYSVTGAAGAPLPNGLTAAVSATGTGDQRTLTFTTTSALAAGTYPLTVHATSLGLDRTTTLTIVVAAPVAGLVRLDYSACSTATKPIWVAFQDGSGTYTRVNGTGDVYTFNVASTKGAFATVTQNGTVFNTTVQYFAQSETAGIVGSCTATGGKTVNGTLNGVTAGYVASISMGGAQTIVNGPATTFQLAGVAAGSQDLVAYNRNGATPGAALDRLIIRRGLNIADGGSVGLLDFVSAADLMQPTTVTYTVNGAGAGTTISQNQAYLTGTACTAHPLYTKSGTTNSLFVYGVPTASQVATDFYRLGVTEAVTATSSRTISTSFHTLANASVTLPAAIAPTVTINSSALNSYRLLQSTLTLPADYSTASFTYSDTPGNTITLFQSAGYIGGAGTATLAAPDFGSVAGYQASWGPSKFTATNYFTNTFGGSAFGAVCSEGATTKSAMVTGSIQLA
jgi:hypothetical protein